MKKKISRIWSVGLVVVLAASLLLSAAPVAAGELSWGAETGLPSTTGNVLVTTVDIVDLAVGPDGTTLWAVDGEATAAVYALYKSTNGGDTWSEKGLPNSILIPKFVAIAPDDANIVVVAGDTNEVSITSDGGSNWYALGPVVQGAEETVASMTDLAISPEDEGKHYVAISGVDSAGEANVWYFNFGAAVGSWTDTEDLVGFGHGAGPTIADSALAVAFSPNFASDKVMAVVTVEWDPTVIGGPDAVALELYSFSSTAWNDTGASFTAYPVTLDTGAYTAAGTAAISLTPDYLGSDDSMQLAFVGLDSTDAGDDAIYRITGTSVKIMTTGKDIHSIAYDGTNLVAGQASAHRVYRSSDPLASSPTVSTSATLKSPGGADNTAVVVVWNGADVVAGTTGLSSSFDVSSDNGATFTSISLVDDAGFDIHDIAVSADGSVKYLSVDDGVDSSLWRNAGSWQRVLSIKAADLLVRMAPEDPDAVYVADANTANIWYSSDAGDTKWFARTMKAAIIDMAVESANVLYAATGGTKNVYKSTNSGFTWGSAKAISVDTSVTSLRSIGEDLLLASDIGGDMSYTLDGNSNWVSMNAPFATGITQVTASGLGAGDFIYAGTSTGSMNVLRWEIGQSGTTWTDIISGTLLIDIDGNSTVAVPDLESCGVYGLELVDGTLYAMVSDAGTSGSGFIRALSPSDASSTTTWSLVGSALEIFTNAPSTFRVSSGSNKLWVVDNQAGALLDNLFIYEDTVASTGPTLGGPADGKEILVNVVSGGTFSVPFSWERLSKGSSYDLEIALDSGFTEKVLTPTVGSTSSTVSSVQGGSTFMPDTTYYWRVRTDSSGPIYSPWSATRSFTIGELPEAQAPIIIQQPPAPVISVPPTPEIVVQMPEIILPAPTPAPQIVIPAAPAPAPAVPSWAIYAIIIIGAVLVIALIVLIMRTRRPV